jgi:hypothetical protein
MSKTNYIDSINGRKLFAERTEYTKDGVSVDDTLNELNNNATPLIPGSNANITVNGNSIVIASTINEGPSGPCGPQGNPGVTGARGPCGPSGNQGETGAQGNTGVTGAQGPCGPSGAKGPCGPSGNQGANNPGNQGPTGAKGPCGPSGAKGPCGPQGNTGVTGAKGPCGPVGDRGPCGPSGNKGPCGPSGDSNSTGGPQGQQGPTGAKGPCGPSGYQGTNNKGNQGVTGAKGPCGPVGDKGKAGMPGSFYIFNVQELPSTQGFTPTSEWTYIKGDFNGVYGVFNASFRAGASTAFYIEVQMYDNTDSNFNISQIVKCQNSLNSEVFFVIPNHTCGIRVRLYSGTASTRVYCTLIGSTFYSTNQ